MKLSEIVPIESLQAHFSEPIQILSYEFRDFSKILRIAGPDVFASALAVWNRIVNSKPAGFDDQAVSKWVNKKDPLLYQRIQRIIKVPVINGAFYTEAKLNGKTIARVFVLSVYKNTLHLADVYFQNPNAPLPPREQREFRECKGFGLLPKVVDNMKIYARENKIAFLTLTCATRDHVPLFEKHGFKVEDSRMAKIALDYGNSIPMELAING